MPNIPTIQRIKKKYTNSKGKEVRYLVYRVVIRDPIKKVSKRKDFRRKLDAEKYLKNLIVEMDNGNYFTQQDDVTVGDVVDLWFDIRKGKIKPNSMRNHMSVKPLILGPLLGGATRRQRSDYTISGRIPEGCRLIQLLSKVKVKDLTTADIRKWHNLLDREVGAYSAKRAKLLLKSALELGAEDYNYRPPAMPKIIKRAAKPKKTLLTPEDIGQLLDYAEGDPVRGPYYAFPFLAGTRPSEQLALLWGDIDFEDNVIHIQRSQDPKGNVYDNTKTEAGTRAIPMSPRLRAMLLQHRLTCTRLEGKLYRVFPGLGKPQPWPHPRIDGGGQLPYGNWRQRFWERGLKEAEVPYVTPHSARHAFISNLQAQGVEVGLVAKIAGHANPTVTLGHYTQAVRDGHEQIAKLDDAYSA